MGVLLGIGAAMTLLMAFNLSEELSDLFSMFEMMPVMLTIMTAMIIMVTSMMSASYTYSFVLSFGSTRKAAFWGMQWMVLLLIIQVAAIDAIIMKILEAKSGVGFGILFYYILGLFAITGIGQILEVVMRKLGKIGMVLLVAIYCVFGMLIGFSMVSTTKSVSLLEYIMELNLPKTALLIGTLVLYIAGALVSYLNLKKFEVKI